MAEIIDTQQIKDPSTTGVQGLKGINSSAFRVTDEDISRLDQSVDMFFQNLGLSDSPTRNDLVGRSPSLSFIGNENVGDSRFDYKMDWASDFDDLAENRGRLQSGFEQIGIGVLKGGVLAGTTFLDGVVGTVFGLGNLAIGGSFLDNPFSQAMQSINQWSEEALPSYYREHELNSPWYRNIFTANFIGDKFIKNLGFAVGAAYAGRVNAGAMSRIMGMNKARQAFKGAMVAKDADLANQSSQQIARNLASGKYSLSPGVLTDDLIKQAYQIKNRNAILQMTGAITAGVGEARIESIGVADEYIEEKTALLDAELQNYIREQRMNLLQQEDGHKYFEMVQGPDGQMSMEPTLEANNLIYEGIRERHEQALANIHEDAARVGNITFLTNAAVLTASDWVQFGKFYAGGYRTARKAKNITRDATGKYSRSNTTLQDIARIAQNPLIEGNEEMLQGVAALGAGYMYENDSFLSAEVDPESNRQTMGYLKAMMTSIKESYGDVDNYEEFFIGALTGALGVPSFQGIQGGIAQEVRESRQQRAKDLEAVDQLNKMWTPELQEYYKNLVRNNTYENLKEDAADKGDEFTYKNHEHDQLLSNVITFDANGRIEDLIELVEGFGNISTQEDIDQVKANTIDKETGKSVYDGMTNEQIIEQVKKQAQEYSDLIKTYQTISSNLQVVAGKDHTSQGLKELTWMLSKIDNWESRFRTLHGEVMSELGNIHMLDDAGQRVNLASIFDSSPESFLSYFTAPMQETLKPLYDKAIKDKKEADKLKKRVDSGWKTTRSKGYQDAYAKLQVLKEAAHKSNDQYSQARDVYTKIDDMQKMLESRADFINEYNRYLTMPQALEEKIKKVIEEAEKNEEKFEEAEDRKSDIPTEETLKDVQDLNEFKEILAAYKIPGLSEQAMASRRRRIADRLSKQDHPVAMRYMDISDTARGMRHIITDIIGQRQNQDGSPVYEQAEINTALNMLNHLMDKVESGQELRDPDNVHLRDIRKQFDDNGKPLFGNPILANKGINIIKESLKDIDKAKNQVGKSVLSFSRDANQESKDGVQKSDPKPETKSRLPVKEKPAAAATMEDLSGKEPKGKVFNDPIPGASKEDVSMSFRENSKMDERSKDPGFATEDNPHKFWKSPFSEHDLDDLKAGNPRPIHENPKFSGLKAIWNILSDRGAWKFVNQGNLRPGDEITFRIEPKVSNQEGITGNPILIYKGDMLVGVMPEGGAKYHLGMKQVIDWIKADYDAFLSKDPENANNIYQSPIKTKVSEVLPGRMLFTGKWQRSLSSVFNIKERPITLQYVKAGVLITPNVQDSHLDVGLVDPSDKEGRIYYRVLGADGRYYSAELNVKHFNEKEFDLNSKGTQGTQTYKNLLSIANKIYDALINDNGSILEAKDQINNILYFPGELNFFKTTSQGQTSIQIALKQEGAESNIFNEFIIVGTPERRRMSISDEGLTNLPSEQAQMRPKDEVVMEILQKLQAHNPKFQVAGSLINTPGYNEQLTNDGIFQTNLLDAIPGSAWFKMEPIKPDGTPYTRDELGLKEQPSNQRAMAKPERSNPVGGTETVSPQTSVTYRGQKYNIGPRGEIEGNVNPIHRPMIEDLALIKLAEAGRGVPGVQVQRSKDGSLIRLKRADNSYVWFVINQPQRDKDGTEISDASRSPIEYLGIPEANKAEQQYRDAIGEDAYNRSMGITVQQSEPQETATTQDDNVQTQSIELRNNTYLVDINSGTIINEKTGKQIPPTSPVGVQVLKKVDWEQGDVSQQEQAAESPESKARVAEIERGRQESLYIVTQEDLNEGNDVGIRKNEDGSFEGEVWSADNVLVESYKGTLKEVQNAIKDYYDAELATLGAQITPQESSTEATQLKQQPAKKTSMPAGFMDIAKGAGLKVNENFVPKEKVQQSKDLILSAESSFEQFAELFPGSVARKGITKAAWDKMSKAAKEHEIKCGIPF